MKTLCITIITTFAFWAISCESPLSASDKTGVVEFIKSDLTTNRDEFSQIAEFLDSFKPDKKSISIFKFQNKKNVDGIYDSASIRQTYINKDLPSSLPLLMDKTKIRAIFIDSTANYAAISFIKVFDKNSRIYLFYIKKRPFINNEETLLNNFNAKDSTSWLYLIDNNWAIRSF